VDDEPVVRDYLEDFFTSEQCMVNLAPEANSALQLMKTKGYDLILLHIKLLRKDGQEFYEKIKRDFPSDAGNEWD